MPALLPLYELVSVYAIFNAGHNRAMFASGDADDRAATVIVLVSTWIGAASAPLAHMP
jgi:hypothetical protein